MTAATGTSEAHTGPESDRDLSVTEALRRLAALTPAQRALLQCLGDAGEPVTAGTLAREARILTSSVRETLDVLVSSGLVRRLRMPVTGPGRPSYGYEAATPTDVGGTVAVYLDVLVATAAVLWATHPGPQDAARQIGRTWAEEMVGEALPDHRRHDDASYADLSLADHMDKIAFFFSSLGFGARVEADRRTISCRSCPFLRDGRVDPLLCEVHRGMTERVIELTARGHAYAVLRPWVSPAHCEVVVGTVGGPLVPDSPA